MSGRLCINTHQNGGSTSPAKRHNLGLTTATRPKILTGGASMDLRDYQHQALKTDQMAGREDTLIVPLLGLAGEAGTLISEYKKFLRDGEAHRLHKDRVGEELGDLLWYLANVASK